MNILQINLAPKNWKMCSDYQADMLLHGLRQTDNFVYDWPRMSHMYSDLQLENRQKIWGKGFTVYGTLLDIKRLSEQEIEDKDWDLVICTLHHTYSSNPNKFSQLVNILVNQHGKDRVVIVDGWDRPEISSQADYLRQYGVKYFKREFYSDRDFLNLHPIHFGIPEEKIQSIKQFTEKQYDIAPLIPVNHSIDPSYSRTYIYDSEQDYYEMYRSSKFALTSKKGGWDTLRHYEIIACGSIPIFIDVEKCPKMTLYDWPKELLSEAKQYITLNFKDETPQNIIDDWNNYRYLPHCGFVDIENPGSCNIKEEKYNDILNQLRYWLYTSGTTKAIAANFLKTLNRKTLECQSPKETMDNQ